MNELPGEMWFVDWGTLSKDNLFLRERDVHLKLKYWSNNWHRRIGPTKVWHLLVGQAGWTDVTNEFIPERWREA